MLQIPIQSGIRPVYRAIVEAVAAGIADGRFRPGDRLPPQRELAQQLNLAVATVGRAYAELEAQGRIASHVGRGTFIAALPRLRLPEAEPASQLGHPVDLATYRTPVPPVEVEFTAALQRLGAELGPQLALSDSPAAGRWHHRAALAEWLSGFGVAVEPSQVIVTDGGQHATMAALSTLTHPGDAIATEELTDARMKAVAGYLDRRLAPVAMDGDGMIPEALEQLCRSSRIAAIFVTPRCQNPTNSTLPAARRAAIVAIARAFDLPIVESDIYGTILDTPEVPLFALAPERTHFVTSLGRILGPGLKVGCLVSPAGDVLRTQAGVGMSTGSATPLMAELALHWLAENRLQGLIDWQRAENGRRLAVLRRFPLLGAARAHPHSAHVWLTLPEPWRAEEFVAAAASHNIGIAQTHSFVVGRRSLPHAVRLCIGAPPSLEALEGACERLERLLGTAPRSHVEAA